MSDEPFDDSNPRRPVQALWFHSRQEEREEGMFAADENGRLTNEVERERAREQAKSSLLLLILLLLILWLIAAATGRTYLLRPFNPQGLAPTIAPVLSPSRAPNSAPSAGAPGGFEYQPGQAGDPIRYYPVGPTFTPLYNQFGGEAETIFGRAISDELGVPGQRYQWFERALLKQVPQFANTEWYIQGELLGAEVTRGIPFPPANPALSQSNGIYFYETNHGISEPFLTFWNNHRGIWLLGYPISDQVHELLPDGRDHVVQYFERGRLEYHPEQAGTPYEVQIGLLGRTVYLNENWPRIIGLPAPTPFPPPAAAR